MYLLVFHVTALSCYCSLMCYFALYDLALVGCLVRRLNAHCQVSQFLPTVHWGCNNGQYKNVHIISGIFSLDNLCFLKKCGLDVARVFCLKYVLDTRCLYCISVHLYEKKIPSY